LTIEAVLELIDQAPAFAEAQPLSAEDLRKAGLAALDAERARLRNAEGDARAVVLQEAAHAAGTIAGAGAIEEALAKALLEAAALDVGLIKDLGAKAVKSTITAAMKAGKKVPRDFSIGAIGAMGADADIMSQSRPGEAGNSAAVHILPSPEDPAAAVLRAPAPPRPSDSGKPPHFIFARCPRAP
jgi:putative DNA primase/helicase